MTNTTTGIILLLSGLVAFVGAVLDWRIVVGSHKLLNRLLGDTTARIITGAAGLTLIVLGIGMLAGLHWFGG